MVVEDLGAQSGGPDLNFKSHSCIMQGDKCIPHQEAEVHSPTKGLYTHKNQFYLDGRAFRILSGSFHYFRTQPAQWGDRLLKMKAAGLNVVTTYIPWNLHEKVRGRFDFAGRWDVASFIRQVDKVGLKMIIRPGPYICSEWDLGGLPSWLLSDPNMDLRTSQHKPYLVAVEAYFAKLMPILAAYQYKKGSGPVIAFQVENEFGSFGKDPIYMGFVKEQLVKYGITEMLITSDGSYGLENGSVDGALMTVNFQKDVDKNLNALMKAQPTQPFMVTEFWSGWFDHWGEKHHSYEPVDMETKVMSILRKYNASINLYMFVGGTNFEFWNGANNISKNHSGYAPTITSYDYDAPISECGDIKPKYYAIKNILKTLNLAALDLPEIPANSKKTQYQPVDLQEHITYRNMIMLVSREKKKTLRTPSAMEYLDINEGGGQGYGYLLYQTTVTEASSLQLQGPWFDRAQVFFNEKHVGTFTWNDKVVSIPLSKTSKENTLDILVENMGRVNFYARKLNRLTILNEQRKGILGSVLADGIKLEGKWFHVPFEFDELMIKGLSSSSLWSPFEPQAVPAAYRTWFHITAEPQDTFLVMDTWGKGIVIVNGFNIGRYWKKGPQKTLYVPAPLLNQGSNEVIVFETEGLKGMKPFKIWFSDVPMLG